jgi:hypothetical protein
LVELLASAFLLAAKAYVNMLPRSVARVMQELSQLAWRRPQFLFG